MSETAKIYKADEIRAEIIGIKKESKQSEQDTLSAVAGAIEPPYNLYQLAEFYEDSTWHYRCVNAKVQTTCGLGWEIVSTNKDKQPDAEYKKLVNFLENPNPKETFFELLQKFWIDYEALGNAYFEIALNNIGEIGEFYHIPAYTMRKMKSEYANKGDYVQLRLTAAQRVYFESFSGDNKRPDLNKIAHLYSYYLKSDYYGMPDFLPALGAMKLNDYATQHHINYFENGAIPAFAIIVEGGALTTEAKNLVQNFLRNNYKGVSNSGRTLYIPTTKGVTVRFESLEQEIKYTAFAKMRIDNRDEIIAAHGVPPRLITIAQAGQLGGTSEAYYQLKIFKELIINPRQKRLETFLNNIFKIGLGIENWQIRFNDIDIENPIDNAYYVSNLRSSEIISTNEGRARLGLNTIEDETYNQLELAKAVNKLRKELEKAL